MCELLDKDGIESDNRGVEGQMSLKSAVSVARRDQ